MARQPAMWARPRSGHAPQGKVHTPEKTHDNAGSASHGRAARHNTMLDGVRESFKKNLPPRARHHIKD